MYIVARLFYTIMIITTLFSITIILLIFLVQHLQLVMENSTTFEKKFEIDTTVSSLIFKII